MALSMQDVLNRLNVEQRTAATAPHDAPVVIFAGATATHARTSPEPAYTPFLRQYTMHCLLSGAGTGKTTTILARIQWLINQVSC